MGAIVDFIIIMQYYCFGPNSLVLEFKFRLLSRSTRKYLRVLPKVGNNVVSVEVKLHSSRFNITASFMSKHPHFTVLQLRLLHHSFPNRNTLRKQILQLNTPCQIKPIQLPFQLITIFFLYSRIRRHPFEFFLVIFLVFTFVE